MTKYKLFFKMAKNKMYPVKWTLNKKVFYSLGFLMR